MKRLTLGDLIEGFSGRHFLARHPVGLEMPVRPVVDSRKAEPGTVFFAFKGENVDGHDYIADAFARGAVAAVVEREVDVPATRLDIANGVWPTSLATPLVVRVPGVLTALQNAARFWRKQLNPRVIGITGSVGKTTTKEVVARVLASQYRVLRSEGSYNNEIGLPLTILHLTDEHEWMVLEMGMYVPGDIRFLAKIAVPHIGIVTNVEPVHAERAGSIENIALGKRELVEILPSAPEGVAILNHDDSHVRAMAEHTQARIFFYGFSPEATLWVDEVESLGLEGVRVRLHYGRERLYLRVPLLGRHSAHTVLRATAAALVAGLTWQDIVVGLRSMSSQLRLVAVPGPNGSLILDDTYNASPPSTLAALNLLEDLDGRKIAVLGDMLELGDYEEAGHLKVGGRAAAVAAELVTVGERSRHIARGARLCGMSANCVHEVTSSESAVAFLRQILRPGDVILVKGSRAMGMEQIVKALVEEGEWNSR
ncbi:MAG: UDP-N-acetylmuramoyl-tripeptide--D-alanyl-D-alanine ligase [Anaerolineae bacterium]|nr:UDP-N-acetylmuramoyl-tripeptide--D-alanyl-D-alanine ligase [Anaerolineae bacterium]